VHLLLNSEGFNSHVMLLSCLGNVSLWLDTGILLQYGHCCNYCGDKHTVYVRATYEYSFIKVAFENRNFLGDSSGFGVLVTQF
jgi:hypothetical protein